MVYKMYTFSRDKVTKYLADGELKNRKLFVLPYLYMPTLQIINADASKSQNHLPQNYILQPSPGKVPPPPTSVHPSSVSVHPSSTSVRSSPMAELFFMCLKGNSDGSERLPCIAANLWV